MKFRNILLLATNLICAVSYGASDSGLYQRVSESRPTVGVNSDGVVHMVPFGMGLDKLIYCPIEVAFQSLGMVHFILRVQPTELNSEGLKAKAVEYFAEKSRYFSRRNLFDGIVKSEEINVTDIEVLAIPMVTEPKRQQVNITDSVGSIHERFLQEVRRTLSFSLRATVKMNLTCDFGERYTNLFVGVYDPRLAMEQTVVISSRTSFLEEINRQRRDPLPKLQHEDFLFTGDATRGYIARILASGLAKHGSYCINL